MRFLSNKKGQVRVIEAFFASVLLLSCLTLIPAQTPTKNSSGDIAWKAENVLLTLDNDGHLANFVDNRDCQLNLPSVHRYQGSIGHSRLSKQDYLSRFSGVSELE
jgi:hypothetical protein